MAKVEYFKMRVRQLSPPEGRLDVALEIIHLPSGNVYGKIMIDSNDLARFHRALTDSEWAIHNLNFILNHIEEIS